MENGSAIRRVCREFVVLCRELNLFVDAIVAIDGSKFKAVNNRDKNFTEQKLKLRMQHLEESIARYMADLDRADRESAAMLPNQVSRLTEKITKLKAQMKNYRQIGRQLKNTPDGQISLTDPDSRSMASSGKGTGIVGYNVQVAVDAEHHLIVAHEVTNIGHDRCPAGERLIWRYSTVEAGRKLHCYWSSACGTCSLKQQCTPGEQRRVRRWEHEHVLEAMQRRLDCAPEASRVRRQTVEHPFGTLKAWMGSTHFLTKMLPRVSTEMSLHVLAYNFKRMMRIVGVRPLIQAMKA